METEIISMAIDSVVNTMTVQHVIQIVCNTLLITVLSRK